MHELGTFVEYSMSALIEEAFYHNKPSFDVPRTDYTIFFGKNGNPHLQFNSKTKLTRTVRRGCNANQKQFFQNQTK